MIDKTKILLTIAVIMFVIGLCVISGKKQYVDNYTYDSVVVSVGDTLWDIAEEYCPNNMDKRKYVYYIQEDNNCTSDIHVGDVLGVRLYKGREK